MKSIRFRKEKISIHNIGHQRFWIDIGAGLITAIAISLFFNYFREGFRFLTILRADLYKDYGFPAKVSLKATPWLSNKKKETKKGNWLKDPAVSGRDRLHPETKPGKPDKYRCLEVKDAPAKSCSYQTPVFSLLSSKSLPR